MISRNAVTKHEVILNPKVAHKAKLHYSVHYGVPNGDPENGGEPRIAPDDYGLVSDVRLKRLVRDYLGAHLGHTLYMDRDMQKKMGRDASTGYGTLADWSKHIGAETPEDAVRVCQDVRLWGAVFNVASKNGKKGSIGILGPAQAWWGRSTEPISGKIEEHSITCMNTREGGGKDRTMGTRMVVTEADYEQRIVYSGHLGEKRGVTREDMADLWEALVNGWEFRTSACRGEMWTTKLVITSYPNDIGAFDPDNKPVVTVIENPDH